MDEAARVLGALVAVAAVGSWLWVAGFNWSVAVRALVRPAERAPSMILLAGPVLVVVALQGLRVAAPPAVGGLVLPLAGLALALDPGALPLLVVGLVRGLHSGRPRGDGSRGANPEA